MGFANQTSCRREAETGFILRSEMLYYFLIETSYKREAKKGV